MVDRTLLTTSPVLFCGYFREYFSLSCFCRLSCRVAPAKYRMKFKVLRFCLQMTTFARLTDLNCASRWSTLNHYKKTQNFPQDIHSSHLVCCQLLFFILSLRLVSFLSYLVCCQLLFFLLSLLPVSYTQYQPSYKIKAGSL